MKKQSEVLESAINRLRGLAEVNEEYMDADDYGDLQTTIKELVKMKLLASALEYRQQVEKFVKDLQEGCVESDGDEWHKWCQTPYTITHGDKQVMIENCADFYEGLLSLLKDHLEDID